MEVRASSTVLLPYTAASVAVARRRLTDELLGAGIRGPAAQDAALVMSELLSNALRHAHPLPDGHVRVGWAIDADMVEVTVSDGGAVTRPRASRPSLSSLGGRGLSIVTHLTWRWGVRTDDRGTTVWALVLTPPVNGGRAANIGGVTERQTGDTYGDIGIKRQSQETGGDREPHPRRGQRGRAARHGPIASSGLGTAADNPAK
jgi:anti-sigma regulatory factor (Ser/Thr protein kinase)